jgi:hypothetical protein
MGLMQRQKGKAFERKIAAMLRSHWPEAVIRRASQAERADNPDVFIEGGPPILARLWLEMQDARAPTPIEKLGQAERDIHAWNVRRGVAYQLDHRLPVAIWHRLGERKIWVTTRMWVVDALRVSSAFGCRTIPITMALEDLIHVLRSTEPLHTAKEAA